MKRKELDAMPILEHAPPIKDPNDFEAKQKGVPDPEGFDFPEWDQ